MTTSVTRTSFLKSFSVALFSFSLLLFASCSKSGDKVAGAEFVGQYIVEDEDETYTLIIENKGGNKFQIKEFGGFLNAPLNAVLEGSVLKIPSQTFSNPNGNSITISGSGTLSTKSKKDDTVRFVYSLSGYTSYDSDFEGTRK